MKGKDGKGYPNQEIIQGIIDIFYGTREVMIAYLKEFQEICRKYGVKLNTHIGKDMMHCWGAMEFVPEARAVRREYFNVLR